MALADSPTIPVADDGAHRPVNALAIGLPRAVNQVTDLQYRSIAAVSRSAACRGPGLVQTRAEEAAFLRILSNDQRSTVTRTDRPMAQEPEPLRGSAGFLNAIKRTYDWPKEFDRVVADRGLRALTKLVDLDQC